MPRLTQVSSVPRNPAPKPLPLTANAVGPFGLDVVINMLVKFIPYLHYNLVSGNSLILVVMYFVKVKVSSAASF